MKERINHIWMFVLYIVINIGIQWFLSLFSWGYIASISLGILFILFAIILELYYRFYRR